MHVQTMPVGIIGIYVRSADAYPDVHPGVVRAMVPVMPLVLVLMRVMPVMGLALVLHVGLAVVSWVCQARGWYTEEKYHTGDQNSGE